MIRLSILFAFTLAVALGGCGGSDAVSSDEAPDRAASIAARTDELVNDVRDSAREYVQDPSARADTQATLRARAQDAEELADRARDELPEGTAGREQLEQVNRRLADATKDLIDADDPERSDLDGAQAAIEDATAKLRVAAGDISSTKLPEAAKKRLDALRDQAP